MLSNLKYRFYQKPKEYPQPQASFDMETSKEKLLGETQTHCFLGRLDASIRAQLVDRWPLIFTGGFKGFSVRSLWERTISACLSEILRFLEWPTTLGVCFSVLKQKFHDSFALWPCLWAMLRSRALRP